MLTLWDAIVRSLWAGASAGGSNQTEINVQPMSNIFSPKWSIVDESENRSFRLKSSILGKIESVRLTLTGAGSCWWRSNPQRRSATYSIRLSLPRTRESSDQSALKSYAHRLRWSSSAIYNTQYTIHNIQFTIYNACSSPTCPMDSDSARLRRQRRHQDWGR